MKIGVIAILFAWLSSGILAQQIPHPEEILGFEMGSQFSRHHEVVDYFEAVAAGSPLVRLHSYGKTPEGRPLMAAIITSEKNQQRLEAIRLNNLQKASLMAGKAKEEDIAIIWMSYNVHGDEAVCSESAMLFLYELTQNEAYRPWLDSLVVILDPCLNPDGRDRYVNWYRQVSGLQGDANPHSWEHQQSWPGGRFNHYLFDLNRDWAWQSQPESQQRVAFYQEWMPQLHVDFHEMGYNSPYFFAPAAEPYHPQITSWQRRFQQLMGANHARYFDQNHWLYYTGEVFDLYYPSYGDTWPIFNGAQGFTYEQGGSGRAGRLVRRERGDSLYLAERLQHHLTTSISTVELAFAQRKQLLSSYEDYFKIASTLPTGTYKSYIVKQTNQPGNIQALCQLLDRQQIAYSFVASDINKNFEGYSFFKNREQEKFTVEKGDLLISSFQPQGRLVQVLFEPHTALSDSLTYDLTAWALPYAYQVEAYACKSRINLTQTAAAPGFQPNELPEKSPYAIFCPWSSVKDLQLLSALLQKGIHLRYAKAPISVDGKQFGRGTLIISAAENKPGYEKEVVLLANKNQCELSYISSGMLEGNDIGSGSQAFIDAPRVALVGGEEITPTSFGEVWHYFEQVLHYPISLLHTDFLDDISLNEYDVIILPSGNLEAYRDQLLNFANKGGKLLVMEKAIQAFSQFAEDDDKNIFTQLAKDMLAAEKIAQKRSFSLDFDLKLSRADRYEDQERSYLSNTIAGSIYRLTLDESHPLAFGFGNETYLMKRNKNTYPLLGGSANSHQNVGIFGEESHIMGFVGARIKQKVDNSLAIGVENYGDGKIIYMTDSPIFRAFWHSGKLLMGNAIFF